MVCMWGGVLKLHLGFEYWPGASCGSASSLVLGLGPKPDLSRHLSQAWVAHAVGEGACSWESMRRPYCGRDGTQGDMWWGGRSVVETPMGVVCALGWSMVGSDSGPCTRPSAAVFAWLNWVGTATGAEAGATTAAFPEARPRDTSKINSREGRGVGTRSRYRHGG